MRATLVQGKGVHVAFPSRSLCLWVSARKCLLAEHLLCPDLQTLPVLPYEDMLNESDVGLGNNLEVESAKTHLKKIFLSINTKNTHKQYFYQAEQVISYIHPFLFFKTENM